MLPPRLLLVKLSRGIWPWIVASAILIGGVAPFHKIASADETGTDSKSTETFSPLHSLLGIDPETGQFKSPAPLRDSNRQADSSDANSRWSTDHRIPELNQLTNGNNKDDLAQSIQTFVERVRRDHPGEELKLDSLRTLLLNNQEVMNWNSRIAWVSAALMLIYPLGLMFSELFAFWWQSREVLAKVERQYLRTRLARSLTLAGAISGLILLATMATVNVAWWTSPTKLIALAVAAGVLGILSVALSLMIKQAVLDRNAGMLRELRQQQLELTNQLAQLRGQLQDPREIQSEFLRRS